MPSSFGCKEFHLVAKRGKTVASLIPQVAVIGFDGEHIVSALIDKLGGNVLLATNGINDNQPLQLVQHAPPIVRWMIHHCLQRSRSSPVHQVCC
jgi:hypothetical protein